MPNPATIVTPVSDRQLADADSVLPYLNREGIPLLREIRAALNQEGSQLRAAVTAGAGAYVVAWTAAMPSNTAWLATAYVVGITPSGTRQSWAYTLQALFASDASAVVTQVGATATLASFETAAAADARLRVTGNAPVLEVADDGASPGNWRCQVVVLASAEIKP